MRDKHDRLIEQAAAINPDTDTIEALTEENRLASNIRAAQSREASFSGLIDMIYEFVPAHTYALFLKERSGEEDVYALRARRSDSDEWFLAPLGEVLTPDKDNGIISGCIRHMQPQYLSNMENSPQTLAYYVTEHAHPVHSGHSHRAERRGHRGAGRRQPRGRRLFAGNPGHARPVRAFLHPDDREDPGIP